MVDDQIRRVLEKTFHEVNVVVKEVQKEKETKKKKSCLRQAKKKRASELKNEECKV